MKTIGRYYLKKKEYEVFGILPNAYFIICFESSSLILSLFLGRT